MSNKRKSEAKNAKAKRSESNPSATVDRIVSSAYEVLIEHGYAGFTTRRVAESAQISPGNLSYHFPTKSALIRAVVEHLVTYYKEQFSALLADSSVPPGQAMEELVQWLLKDTLTKNIIHIFRELWAISLHDEVVRDYIDDLYDELMDSTCKSLIRSYPDINETSIRELLQMLALISEGSIVLYGTRRKRKVSYERIIALFISLMENIVPEFGNFNKSPKN